MKKASYKTESYKSGSWTIDIVEKKDMFEAWLQKENYGYKMHMFGWLKVQHPFNNPDGETWTKEMFIDLVMSNLNSEKRIYNMELEKLERE